MKGKFIVIEGLDGSGKSTQAAALANYLREPKQRRRFGQAGVQVTSEPTPGLIGGLIRSQLSGDWKSSPACLQLLFAADRAYHVEKEVAPLLKRGITVISDRYFFSSLVYGALSLPLRWLIEINKHFPVPDATFILEVSARTCIRRIAKHRHEVTLFEKEKELEKVAVNYRRLAKKFKNMYFIDGERPASAIAKDIIAILGKKL